MPDVVLRKAAAPPLHGLVERLRQAAERRAKVSKSPSGNVAQDQPKFAVPRITTPATTALPEITAKRPSNRSVRCLWNTA